MAQAADSITRGLKTWLEARFSSAELVIDDAAPVSGSMVIRVVLASLGVDRSSRQVTALTLTYRISVEGDDAYTRHGLMSEVAFALTESPLLALDDGGTIPLDLKPAEKNDALGLTVTARLLRDQRAPSGPPVLQPLVLELAEIGGMDGRVATPDGGPVADALVEIPSLALRQTSRSNGSFQFSGLPAGAGPFTVIARKNRAETRANARPGDHLALVLSVEA